jgi:hypothetical protein
MGRSSDYKFLMLLLCFCAVAKKSPESCFEVSWGEIQVTTIKIGQLSL